MDSVIASFTDRELELIEWALWYKRKNPAYREEVDKLWERIRQMRKDPAETDA